MAMMEGVQQVVQDNVIPDKATSDSVPDSMVVDVKVTSEINGHSAAPTTSSTGQPSTELKAVTDDGDIAMGNNDPPTNGLLDATELITSVPTTSETLISAPQINDVSVSRSNDEVLSAPDHVEQPVSEVRDEAPATAPAPAPVMSEGDLTRVDQTLETLTAQQTSVTPKLEVTTISGDVSMASPTVEEAPLSTIVKANVAQESVVQEPAVTKAEIKEDVSAPPALGQVRQRDEDDENEPIAKRAKITPEPNSISQPSEVLTSTEPVSDSVMESTTESAIMDAAEPSTEPATVDAIEPTVESAPLDATEPNIAKSTEASAGAATPSTMAAPGLPASGPGEFEKGPLTKSQTRYLLDSVRKAKKIKAAIPFLNAVDPVALNIPSYPTIVPNPMDLGTIEDKLKNERYTSANELWGDFQLMASNALAFNGPNHPVTQHGLNLRAYFNKLMQSIPKGDATPETTKKAAVSPKPTLPRRESRHIPVTKPSPAPVPKPTPKAAPKPKVEAKKHEPVLDSNGVPIIRRASESERPKREIIKPQSKDMPYSTTKPKKKSAQLELKFCEQVVMKEIKKAKNQTFAYPFMLPVDPVALNIPTYHTVIKKPMDFGTIERNLQKGEYNNAKEFAVDARLVFKNCFAFNGPNEPVHVFGQQLEALFEELWEQKDEWIAANQPASEPVSDEESEAESSEDEPESTEERMRKVAELQKQIAALTAQVIELTNPPVPKAKKRKSKAKSETTKKQKRPSAGGANSSSKPSKAKKAAKPKKLTLEQKRYVSEGIMMLDEVNMRKAVQMIRNGVPKLKDVNDDELELDVDEIPDPVLQTLHKFVKDYRRANGTDIAEDDDYEEVEEAPKHASSHRKKSKPMSAREQESRIAQVKQQLQQFEGGSGSDQANNNEDDGESSDDVSSSSEEE